MSDHPPPRPLPPRLIALRNTPEILKQTATSIFSTSQNLLMVLLLSLFLLSLRGNIETATHFITSFIDNSPPLKSLLDRNYGPPNLTSPTSSTITTRRRPFASLLKPQLNATLFILEPFDPQLGLSSFVCDNGIRASENVRSTAKTTSRLIEIIQKEENVVLDEINDSTPFNEPTETQTYYQFFLKEMDLEHDEFTSMMVFSLAFGASFVFMMEVFYDTYTKIHGIIFVLVLNDFCKRNQSFHLTFLNGSTLGLNRLSLTGIVTIIWTLRFIVTHLICFWFLGEIDDPYFSAKLFFGLKYSSFSMMTHWDEVFEKKIFRFIVSCFLIDMLMSLVFAMGAWIVMADSRKNEKDAVKEGCYLLSLKIETAIEIKCYECILCGAYARWVLTRYFGMFFTLAFQSFMEVYFMIAWMVYYLSVKSIHANSSGQHFGQRELEAMLRNVR